MMIQKINRESSNSVGSLNILSTNWRMHLYLNRLHFRSLSQTLRDFKPQDVQKSEANLCGAKVESSVASSLEKDNTHNDATIESLQLQVPENLQMSKSDSYDQTADSNMESNNEKQAFVEVISNRVIENLEGDHDQRNKDSIDNGMDDDERDSTGEHENCIHMPIDDPETLLFSLLSQP